MSWPFTPHTTFTDNTTPRITADFLNDIQRGVNAAALAGYGRVRYTAKCQSSTSVAVRLTEPVIVRDSATSQFVAVDPDGADWVLSPSASAGWNYIYVGCANGVASFDMTTTAPDSTLRIIGSDETKRYVCAVYSTGSTLRTFHARNGVYAWEEQVPLVGNPFAAAVFTWQTVDLAALNAVPPTATAFTLQATMSAQSAAYFGLCVRGWDGAQTSGTGAGYARQVVSVGNGSTNRQDNSAALSLATRPGANLFQWTCTTTSGTTAYVSIECHGFEE